MIPILQIRNGAQKYRKPGDWWNLASSAECGLEGGLIPAARDASLRLHSAVVPFHSPWFCSWPDISPLGKSLTQFSFSTMDWSVNEPLKAWSMTLYS